LEYEGGKVISPKHCPLSSPGNISGTHFCQSLIRPQGQTAAGRIIENQTRNLPAFNTVPEPTAPPQALNSYNKHTKYYYD